jgi:hypothetical protein
MQQKTNRKLIANIASENDDQTNTAILILDQILASDYFVITFARNCGSDRRCRI